MIYIYTYHYIIISPFKTVKGHKCRLDPRCSCWNHRNFYSQLLRVKSPRLYPHCIPIHHHYSLFKIQFLCSSFNRKIPECLMLKSTIPMCDASIQKKVLKSPGKRANIAMEHHHFSWVNPLFRLGHFLCRKVWMFTRPGKSPGFAFIFLSPAPWSLNRKAGWFGTRMDDFFHSVGNVIIPTDELTNSYFSEGLKQPATSKDFKEVFQALSRFQW